MLRALLWTVGLAAGTIALGCVACTALSPWRRELAHRRLDERVPVDLEGVATVSLPPTFHLAGVVSAYGRARTVGGATTLEHHRDDERLTYRFEQGQHHALGGHLTDPVVLDVTLFADALPAAEIGRAAWTTIDRFYPPTDDRAELAARFARARWLPELRDGAAVTRAAPDEDMYDASHPARWLVVHTDPARRVRVDLYAWQKAYTLDEARRLARAVAEGVATTPRLQSHFAEDVPNYDRRMADKLARAVDTAASALAACGVARLAPGEVTWGDACAAHLSADRTRLRVARLLGRVPRAAASQQPGEPPRYRLAERRLEWHSRDVDGLPELHVGMLYWDAGAARWAMLGLQSRLYDDEDRAHALAAAVMARLADRERVHLVIFDHFALDLGGRRADVAAFLAQAARIEGSLRAGKVILDVPVAPASFAR